MRMRFSELWTWKGTIDRGPYLLIGVIGFAIKHNLDRLVSTFLFQQPWGIFSYILPFKKLVLITELTPNEAAFVATMVALALPFIWVGVVLTIRRLRSATLPAWLALLFFIPIVNLLLFAVLSIVPPTQDSMLPPDRPGRGRKALDWIFPEHPLGSAALGVVLTGLLAVFATLLGVKIFESYGWGLFVGVPFSLGFISALLHGYHKPRSAKACLFVALIALGFYGGLLLVMAFEGLICLIMAAPLALVLTMMGALLACLLQQTPSNRLQAPALVTAVCLMMPLLFTVERGNKPEAPIYRVQSSATVSAPPALVWRHVVSFAELPPPNELLFRLGIAYPQRAEIRGVGAGAVRLCVFSTGAFEEPIELWDEPRLLRFSVASNPHPMQEWTPYREIHPPHLEGYFLSKKGQFVLDLLPDGRTRLEGTTWYSHNMWPASYWRLWSDYIIHKIHMRVLTHIKHESERSSDGLKEQPLSTSG